VFEHDGLFGIMACISVKGARGGAGSRRGCTEITDGLHTGACFNINFNDNIFAGLKEQ
jgi:hypothetical protein